MTMLGRCLEQNRDLPASGGGQAVRGGSQGKAGFPERPGSKPGAAPAHQRVPSDDKARAAASWPAWGAAWPGGALGTGCWAGRALDSSPSAFPDKARMAVIPRSRHNPASLARSGLSPRPEGGCAAAQVCHGSSRQWCSQQPELDGAERSLLPLQMTPGCSPALGCWRVGRHQGSGRPGV